jgi:hypothetical protein
MKLSRRYSQWNRLGVEISVTRGGLGVVVVCWRAKDGMFEELFFYLFTWFYYIPLVVSFYFYLWLSSLGINPSVIV